MRRFLIAPEAVEGETFRLEGPEARHLVKILRAREGQSLELMDGRGAVYKAMIGRIEPDGSVSGTLKILPRGQGDVFKPKLNLYASLIKAARWEWMLEKAAELGVASVTPVLARRSVVELRENGRVEAKLERWRRIMIAAAKQSKADEVPELAGPMKFAEAVRSAAGQGLTLLAWEGLASPEPGPGLRSIIESSSKRLKDGGAVNFFVGPEGGFSEEEASLARAQGIFLFSLGPRILRAETAALAAVSLVSYELRLLRP